MRLPEDVLLVTVGVDVQARYVAILTMGWTPTAEAWAIEWEQLDGDPRDPATLRSVVETAHGLHYAHPTGEIPVHLVGIDSQFLTDYVDAAVTYGNRLRGHRWIFATAGVGGRGNTGDPLLIQIHDQRDARGRRGRRPLLINTDIAKDELAAQLQVTTPGPGYFHIPRRLGPSFVEQLTAEERRDKLDADGTVVGFDWRRRGDVRNEALDCACINLALFHKVTKSQWLHLLIARHGHEIGVELWQERYPGERLAISAPPPHQTARRPWLARRG
jgi:phage terminase large subunit GpA-like protein